MNASVTRPGIEELRERIRRLEGAAGRRRLVLPFGIQTIDGLVTLPNRARSNSAGTSGSRRGDDFVPCLHR